MLLMYVQDYLFLLDQTTELVNDSQHKIKTKHFLFRLFCISLQNLIYVVTLNHRLTSILQPNAKSFIFLNFEAIKKVF